MFIADRVCCAKLRNPCSGRRAVRKVWETRPGRHYRSPEIALQTRDAYTACESTAKEVIKMLRWAFIFLIVALVAALFGFTGIASAAAGIAKFLFFLFLVVCLIFFIIGLSAAKKL
jgi:uncharacterized membrane protein YtjA (UPF0391 family)